MYSFKELQKIIGQEIKFRLSDLNERKPSQLYVPVQYSLEMGGKRIRPVLLLMSFNMFKEEISSALPAAVAMEVFHNFTLLHDDIMDKSALRRNKPTVHMKFGANNAILSGDAMAFLSYQYLLECNSGRISDVIELFTGTALEICEGQQFDMDFENRRKVSEAEYLEMIRLKTAVLLGCSLKAGALLADADPVIAENLYSLGINLGLAFQLQDDFLDTFGNQQIFGKKIGGDILADKKTYLLIKALESAGDEDKSSLEKWLTKSSFDADEKIKAVTGIYNKLDIKQITINKINLYFKNTEKILDDLTLNENKKNYLRELCYKMQNREY